MATLEQIEKTGDLLFGPLVPDWFHGDCSTPKFLGKILKRNLAQQACRNHDWCYLLIPIVYAPDSSAWQLALHTADAQLRWNLTRLRGGKLGRFWGFIYYFGVRLPFVGGRHAVNDWPETHPRRPCTPKQLLETIDCARRFNDGHLTEHAREEFMILARPLPVDIRKELKQ